MCMHIRKRNNSYNAVNVLQWQRFVKDDMCRNVQVCTCVCICMSHLDPSLYVIGLNGLRSEEKKL